MTDRYALFGNPFGHSKSPLIHGGFAKALGHDVDYGLIEAPLGGFAAAAHAFRDAAPRAATSPRPSSSTRSRWPHTAWSAPNTPARPTA